MSDYSIDLSALQAKKRETMLLAESFDRLAVSRPVGQSGVDWRRKASNCRECGTFLRFGVLRAGAGIKLVKANFCRQRLCPSCSYRRSLRVYANISQVLDWVTASYDDLQFAFLTLTVKNVAGSLLGASLSAMSKAYNRFLSNKAVKRRLAGVIRSTEVTYNSSDNTYHPHYHLILALPSSYFIDGSYWTNERWAQAWRTSGGLDYAPVTWIEAIHGQASVVKEVAKYVVKPGDLLAGPSDSVDERVYNFYTGLGGKRLLSYSGVFREARQALSLSDADDDNLIDDVLRSDVFEAFVTYRWGFDCSNYILEKEEVL